MAQFRVQAVSGIDEHELRSFRWAAGRLTEACPPASLQSHSPSTLCIIAQCPDLQQSTVYSPEDLVSGSRVDEGAILRSIISPDLGLTSALSGWSSVCFVS